MQPGCHKDEERVKLFDSWAAAYAPAYTDGSPVSHYFTTRLSHVDALLDIPSGSKVLDIGCGPGMMAEPLVRRGMSFFGVDVSKEMIRACQGRVGDSHECHLAIGSIEHIPFADRCFDACICTGVLEYVENQILAIREVTRVLKPDGVFIISLLNKVSPYRVVENLRFAIRGQARPERMFTERHGRYLVQAAGLKLVDLLYYDFNVFLPPFDKKFPFCSVRVSRRLEFLRRSIVRWIGTAFLIKAIQEKSDHL
jgi:ubiquinone/menaquinone biosynthesis C-methylase UbiE